MICNTICLFGKIIQTTRLHQRIVINVSQQHYEHIQHNILVAFTQIINDRNYFTYCMQPPLATGGKYFLIWA